MLHDVGLRLWYVIITTTTLHSSTQSFQMLKTALDFGNAEAKAKVETLQAHYDEQKRLLEQLQVQEEAECVQAVLPAWQGK